MLVKNSMWKKLQVILILVLSLTLLIFIPKPSNASTQVHGMEIPFKLFEAPIPDINITKIAVLSIGDQIEYRLYYTGTVEKYNMFNPPDGTILQMIKYISQEDINNGYLSFRIPIETIQKCKTFTIFVSNTTDYSERNAYEIQNTQIDYTKAPKMIVFSDNNLSQAIKANLNVTGELFETDVKNIELLDISNKKITNLQGIEYLSNLKTLDVSNNMITDISPINKLDKLKKLYVKGNPIKDYLLDAGVISQLVDYDFEKDYQRALYASKLKEIGVLNGTDNGFELNREPTRIEGLIMLIRLLGKESVALQTDTTTSVFADVPSWAKAYTNYAYYNGLTTGIGNNKFGTNDNIDAKSYITFILRALGYNDSAGDFKWNDAIFYAQNIQLYDNSMQIELNSAIFLRAHVAEISYKALATKMKGSNLTLIQKLIKDNVINKDLAEKLQL
jgi:hypothetical protein